MRINYLSKADKKDLKGIALLRLDFNTEDEWRMEASLPTIRFLIKNSGKVIIFSHRGRPAFTPPAPRLRRAGKVSAGKPNVYDKKFSLKKDAVNLSKMLGKKVVFLPNLDLPGIKETVNEAAKGSVFVLENLRFFKGEEANGSGFAKKLASLGDFYVNDAFAVSHRKNASVSAITRFLPCFAGIEMEKEIKFLSHVMSKPKKPLAIILGGAKAGDKLGVLKYFKNKACLFLIGGATADTLLFLKGVDVKNSMVDKDKKDLASLRAVLNYKNIILPSDLKFENKMVLDIGRRTAEDFAEKIKEARTVIWNGPMGAFEKKKFSYGTIAIARAIAANKNVFSVAGGGETVAFLKKYKLDKKFTFLSTGGGAMLDFLAGEKLPGVEALAKKG
ncbi:MAG TPA: phosphoglycerate kinase [Candidatus Paceibacterota bacterium]|nr:phosphoglycerate kinase [Candidatus Paceibacterota bacterium]